MVSINKIFKALSDPTRREILNLLKDKKMTAGNLLKHFNMTAPSLSKHLSILKEADLIFCERKGNYLEYSLNTTVFQNVINWLMDLSKEDKNNGK